MKKQVMFLGMCSLLGWLSISQGQAEEQITIVETTRTEVKPMPRSQFGFGVSGIPVLHLWNLRDNNHSQYQGGGSLQLLWRGYRAAGEAFFTVTGNDSAWPYESASGNSRLIEYSIGLGPRIYLRSAPRDYFPLFRLMPYGVGVFQATFSTLRGKNTDYSADNYMLGGQFGGGFELRIKKHFALEADARFVVRGTVYTTDTTHDNLDLGVLGRLGLNFYF